MTGIFWSRPEKFSESRPEKFSKSRPEKFFCSRPNNFSTAFFPNYLRNVRKMQKSTLLYCFFCFIHSLEQFWSVRKHFLCYLDQKKWISGTLPALGLRPRAGKIFPWFTFSDLDNIGKNFSHYLKIVLRSGNRKNNITKYNCCGPEIEMDYCT